MKLKGLGLLLLCSFSHADIPVYNSPSDLNYPVASSNDDMNCTPRPYFSLSGGPGVAGANTSQEVYIDPNYSNTYTTEKHNQTIAAFELNIGMQIPVMMGALFQVGPLIGVAGVAKPDGEIWQLSDPEFNNMRYTYNLSQARFGVRARLSGSNEYDVWFFSPYITGSAAIAENYAYNYKNYDVIAPAEANHAFANNSQAAFSYSLGAGIQRDIDCHLRFAVGYEYFSWGKSSLAPAKGQLTKNVLSLNNLYMNTVLITLTYIV